jgi:hypothetical protein
MREPRELEPGDRRDGELLDLLAFGDVEIENRPVISRIAVRKALRSPVWGVR